MVTRRRFLALLGSAGAVGVGVVSGVALLPDGSPEGDGFPVIRYGAEPCTQCGMIIDDARFAAAWSRPGGAARHFDDIGCLVTDIGAHPPPSDARLLVHDYESEAWLDARTAVFVVSPQIRTPMAYGTAAFETAAAAERLSLAVDGRTFRWQALPEQLVRSRS
jgi:copper chaperone NosL